MPHLHILTISACVALRLYAGALADVDELEESVPTEFTCSDAVQMYSPAKLLQERAQFWLGKGSSTRYS